MKEGLCAGANRLCGAFKPARVKRNYASVGLPPHVGLFAELTAFNRPGKYATG